MNTQTVSFRVLSIPDLPKRTKIVIRDGRHNKYFVYLKVFGSMVNNWTFLSLMSQLLDSYYLKWCDLLLIVDICTTREPSTILATILHGEQSLCSVLVRYVIIYVTGIVTYLLECSQTLHNLLMFDSYKYNDQQTFMFYYFIILPVFYIIVNTHVLKFQVPK